MTRKRDKIWTAIIATKQWFTKLFTSEAEALVDDFGNNPPPEIGTQPYSDSSLSLTEIINLQSSFNFPLNSS